MREALVERCFTRVNNMLGGIKIGLANFQMYDLASLGFQRPRLGQHFKRRLGP